MTKEELIDRINDIDWEDFEAKEAKSELPKNIWETLSAFANTSGGWIVLGVKQNGKKFEISGVDNAEKLEQDFLGTLRSQKFNEPVDAKSMLYHIDGHKVLAFHRGYSIHDERRGIQCGRPLAIQDSKRGIGQYALSLRPFQHHSLLHSYLHRQSRVLQCRWLSCAYIPTGQPSLFQSSQPNYRQNIQTGKSIRNNRLWFRHDE